jgi:DNA-binding transcriptional MerR regulator
MAELLDETTTYSIAEAAERLGLSTDTLRYYERDGLLVETPGRAPSGHRRYTESDLGWIVLITRLRATGMPIRTVREYAELCRQGDGNELARLELLYQHRDRVLAQLAKVTEHLGAINYKIGIYEERLTGEAGTVDSEGPRP